MKEKPTKIVAEDRAALGGILIESLESHNFIVELAEEKALKVFSGKRPKVKFIDAGTCEIGGSRLAEKMNKEEDKQIPILFMTAKSRAEQTMDECKVVGRDNLRTSLNLEELILRIESLLLHRRAIEKESLEHQRAQILPVRTGSKTVLLNTSKIRYVIASGYYAEVYTKKRKHVIRESLSNLLEVLDEKKFFRCHRSAIINVNCVKEVVHSGFSEVDVRMKGGKLVRISKSQKKDFFQIIGMK